MKLQNILKFFHEVEALKKLLRHSWLSSNRQESVAEHTWRMTMMALVLYDQLEHKVDLPKTLKMLVLHDLAEIYTGDHHAWKGKLAGKHQNEKSAIKKILSILKNRDKEKELFDLWLEFENNETYEAQFAQAVDKLEVLIQHNEADISTWNKTEFGFNLVYGDDKVGFSEFLKKLRKLIKKESENKISSLQPRPRFHRDDLLDSCDPDRDRTGDLLRDRETC